MYEVMARRYRPASFAEVVGQEHVARTLQNAIRADRVAHAYLFCGGHGCGKTTMARVFAKALVCRQGPAPESCNQCSICQDVARGRDVDVMEIDGASNNGVEQIRTLRDQAGYVPVRARFKIYIIDEVHMLSVPAFNALLKTLEEPPPHVKFILATTDPQKIPETILSRCQRFDFRLVPAPALSAFFKELAAREGAGIEEEALEAVAAFAGGSVRDGLVLLDQLLSYADGTVTRADVERMRGVAGAEAVAGMFRAMAARDARQALAVADEVASRGVNAGDFLDQLIDFGRDLMAMAAAGDAAGLSAYGPARQTLLELAGQTSLERALLMLDVLAAARTRVAQKALSHPWVPLEIAVARLAGLADLAPLSEWTTRLEHLASGAPPPSNPPTAKPPPAPISPLTSTPENRAAPEDGEQTTPAAPPPPIPAPPAIPAGGASPGEAKPTTSTAPTPAPAAPMTPTDPSGGAPLSEESRAMWERAIRELTREHPTDARRLDGIVPLRASDGAILLSGPAYALEAWDDAWRLARLAKVLARAARGAATIRVGDRDATASAEMIDSADSAEGASPALSPPADGSIPESAAAVAPSSLQASPAESAADSSEIPVEVEAEADDDDGAAREQAIAAVWRDEDVLRVQRIFGAKPLSVDFPDPDPDPAPAPAPAPG